MKIELFNSASLTDISSLKFLQNRNILAFKTGKSVKIYRIFQEITQVKADLFAFHPFEPVIVTYAQGALSIRNLQEATFTDAEAIDASVVESNAGDSANASETVEYIKWVSYHTHTLLLLAFNSHVQIRLNGQLTILNLDLQCAVDGQSPSTGHSRVLDMDLYGDLVLVVRESVLGGGDPTLRVTMTRLLDCSLLALER
jgi:hypothetical protein